MVKFDNSGFHDILRSQIKSWVLLIFELLVISFIHHVFQRFL